MLPGSKGRGKASSKTLGPKIIYSCTEIVVHCSVSCLAKPCEEQLKFAMETPATSLLSLPEKRPKLSYEVVQLVTSALWVQSIVAR